MAATLRQKPPPNRRDYLLVDQNHAEPSFYVVEPDGSNGT